MLLLKVIRRFSSKNLLILCITFLLTVYIYNLRAPCPANGVLPDNSRVIPAAPKNAASLVPAVPLPAATQESLFVLHARNLLSSRSGKVRLQQLVPYLVKLSAPNPIYVVQVGANTGYELRSARPSKDDPTVAAVKHPAARGVLVEPVPANFAKLSANVRPYSGRFKCINAAVNTGNAAQTRMTFYTMNAARVRAEWPGALSWFLDQLGSFDINHLKKHFRSVRRWWAPRHRQDYYINRTVVDALPPAAILEKLYEAFPKARRGSFVSLLHVDAEGFDWKIMYAFLKITRPKAIVFENKHLAYREIRSALALIKKSGYAHWHYGQNTYAIHLGASADLVFGK